MSIAKPIAGASPPTHALFSGDAGSIAVLAAKRASRERLPEQRLQAAVLAEALDNIRMAVGHGLIDRAGEPTNRPLYAGEAGMQREAVDALKWLQSPLRHHPFMAIRICESLDIDVGHLRVGVRRWIGRGCVREGIGVVEVRRGAEDAEREDRYHAREVG